MDGVRIARWFAGSALLVGIAGCPAEEDSPQTSASGTPTGDSNGSDEASETGRDTADTGSGSGTASGPGTEAGSASSGSGGSDSATGATDTEDGTGSSTGEGLGPMPCLPAEGPVVVGSIGLYTAPATDALDFNNEPAAGGDFLVMPDGGVGGIFECDLFQQDCPRGEKCMPWASDGGTWNATRCVDLAANPGQPGDECVAQGGGASGNDDCDVGVMCWDVDPETSQGTCTEQCSGSEDAPVCDTEGTACVISNGGALALCLPVCNPLANECPAGQGCYPIGDTVTCAPDVSGEGGAVGDPCAFINVCQDGLWCAGPEAVPGCDDSGCCSAFCTIGDDAACLPGQSCLPYYEEGNAPLQCLEAVGICSVAP